MNTYRATFNGRLSNAIGIFYPMTATIEAENDRDFAEKFYAAYELRPTWNRIGKRKLPGPYVMVSINGSDYKPFDFTKAFEGKPDVKENYIRIEMSERSATVSLTEAGKVYLRSVAEIEGSESAETIRFTLPYDDIWRDLFTNRSGDPTFKFELLRKDTDYAEIGALTDAPIFGYKVKRGSPFTIRRVFWFPQYETRDELAELLFDGSVEFAEAEDMNVDSQMFLNTYECCDQSWQDTWSCMVNDDCPVCGMEVEPTESEAIED